MERKQKDMQKMRPLNYNRRKLNLGGEHGDCCREKMKRSRKPRREI